MVSGFASETDDFAIYSRHGLAETPLADASRPTPEGVVTPPSNHSTQLKVAHLHEQFSVVFCGTRMSSVPVFITVHILNQMNLAHILISFHFASFLSS
jgi:hypothetical protein